MSSLEKYVQKIHKKLNNESLEEQKIKKYLHELDRLEITLDILKATGIGRAVNRYRKHGSSIGDIASCLVTKWKELLKHEPNHCSQSKSSKGEDKGVFHVTSNHRNHTYIQNDGADTLSGIEEEMDHVDNQDVRSRHKTVETKSKARPAPQLCDVSFGCEPVVVKQKKRPTSTASAAVSTKMTSSDNIRPDLELPALPSSLSVNNSLLPEIQPTYKPIRVPEFGNTCTSPKKKKGVVGTELDAHALMSRKSRTQVFSGRKSAPADGVVVSSLFVLSMKVLIENVDALDDTGGVPYDILHPVLEKCNPQQLLHLEECNPYFIEDTEPLWERHCWRDFKGTKPARNQTWRELYMKNKGEREERLKKINEKISASQKAKKPERQVQLAYVTTEAKPPREVRRKQAKFGTGSGVHPSIPVTAPARSVPQAHHRNLGSSPAKKQAVPAPMMKKTMKLFKTQRGRANTSIRRT